MGKNERQDAIKTIDSMLEIHQRTWEFNRSRLSDVQMYSIDVDISDLETDKIVLIINICKENQINLSMNTLELKRMQQSFVMFGH